jgi:hypothetical protein
VASTYLTDAADELYLGDPDEFTARRKELAAAARAAGDREAARDIAALGKPTRSAWLVNRLVRTDPTVPARLGELGDKLRAGEAALDGPSIRKLSAARRELIDSLVRAALAGSAPSAAVREEVADTLNAALADPGIASQVAAGRLVRAAHWAGFGPGVGTALPQAWPSGPAGPDGPVKPQPAASRTPRTVKTGTRAAESEHDRKLRAISEAEQAIAEAELAAQAAASAHRERQQAISSAEQHLAEDRQRAADCDRALGEAQQRVAEAQRALKEAQHRRDAAEQRAARARKSLAQARKDLDEAGAQLRQATAAQRKATQALDRLTGGGPTG